MSKQKLRVILFSLISFVLLENKIYCQEENQKKKGGFGTWLKNVYTDENDNPEKPKYLLFPSIAYSPETSWEFGVSGLNLFYANNDTTNRLSELNSFTFYTLNNQYGTLLEHFIYTDDDDWIFLGKLKAQRFPLLYYGIGPNALKTNEQLISSNYISLRERLLKKISKDFFGGIQADYQRVSKTNIENPIGDINLIPGIKGSSYLGLGLGLVYDTRHNALNVRKGIYAEVANLNYGYIGGGVEKFTSTLFDFRYYTPVKKNHVFAAHIIGQFVSGSPPFNLYSLLGSENIMRGYYYGRYRDNHLMAAQVEYRMLPLDFSKRFGAVAFLAAGGVSPTIKDFSINNILPTAGIGLRYLVFPKKDIYVRVDAGFTREGTAFYIFSGEAF